MFPLDYVLAAALLATAPDPQENPPAMPEQHVVLKTMLQQVAINHEILDPREVRYILTRDEDFQSDLNLLRRRAQDLEDAPLLHECMRFPSRAQVTDLLAFNRAYRQHLEERRALEITSNWDYHETMTEVDRLYQIWDNIRDTRCDYYYITVRRQALKKVRDAVGVQAFYNGTFPPHVPVWRFQRID